MNLVRYFSIQFVFISIIIFANFYLDGLISQPFTYIDLLAILIAAALFTLILLLYLRVMRKLQPIRLFSKALIIVFVFILAFTTIGFFTGQMLFVE